MSALAWWGISGAALIVIAGFLGTLVQYQDKEGKPRSGNVLGILIDERQRFSLTHLQVVLWTLVLLSLLLAVFLARLFNQGAVDALTFTIPPELLGLAGISGGSAVLSTAIKSSHDITNKKNAAERRLINPGLEMALKQVFMLEEGSAADKVIDPTKFQSFFLTLIAVAAYVAMAGGALADVTVPDGLPGFDPQLLWIIGISHGAYLGAKIPQKA
jgi:hypothetical protein